MRQRDLRQIVSDPRLTPEAVRVILHVAMLGSGEHTVKGEEIAILVHGGEKPVRAAITRAVHCGYLLWEKAGRAGHRFTYLPPSSEMTPPGEGKENDSPQGVISTIGTEENDSPRGGISGNDSSGGGISEDPHAPAVPYRGVKEVVEEDVDEGVREAVEEGAAQRIVDNLEVLGAAADALREYLPCRVPRERQSVYVASVLSLLQRESLFDWRGRPYEQRAQTVSEALLDLAASDEAKGHTRPVGDFANLKTKLSVLLSPTPESPRPRQGTEAAAIAERRVEMPGAHRVREGPSLEEVRQRSVASFSMPRDILPAAKH